MEMIDPTKITSVIFDFYGTLSCEPYFKPLGSDAIDAIGELVFADNSARWADPWMRGDLTSRQIAFYLSQHLIESADEILSALVQGCSNMKFNSAVHDFAIQQRDCGRKTALVTANMDVFTQVIVPAHGLETVFDIVLNTADLGTNDKSTLWREALAAFGPEHSFASSLLIDDSPRMSTLFASAGGLTHRYTGDESFAAWLEETGFSNLK